MIMLINMVEEGSCIFVTLCHSLRDRLKKLTAERESLESQLKNEKDERDLYKVGKRSSGWKNKKVHSDQQSLGVCFLTFAFLSFYLLPHGCRPTFAAPSWRTLS